MTSTTSLQTWILTLIFNFNTSSRSSIHPLNFQSPRKISTLFYIFKSSSSTNLPSSMSTSKKSTTLWKKPSKSAKIKTIKPPKPTSWSKAEETWKVSLNSAKYSSQIVTNSSDSSLEKNLSIFKRKPTYLNNSISFSLPAKRSLKWTTKKAKKFGKNASRKFLDIWEFPKTSKTKPFLYQSNKCWEKSLRKRWKRCFPKWVQTFSLRDFVKNFLNFRSVSL